MAHICLFAHAPTPALFCGDTLFNAGAGNCHNGGSPEKLYETFVDQLAKLPAATKIYPGHEYLGRNLAFTIDREPGNHDAAQMAVANAGVDAADTPVTTLADEMRINTFFRLGSAGVIAGLRAKFPDLPARPDPKTVFVKLRELRNHW
jgi:hydroxyacylglutathione hydrolase